MFTTKKYTRPVLVTELKALPVSSFKNIVTLGKALSPRAGRKSAKYNALNNFVGGVGQVFLTASAKNPTPRTFKTLLIKTLSV